MWFNIFKPLYLKQQIYLVGLVKIISSNLYHIEVKSNFNEHIITSLWQDRETSNE